MKTFAAAVTLFTRIPAWRWVSIPQQAYSSAVVWWPLVGWMTGGIAALTLFAAAQVLPLLPAAVIAIVARLLLTGALHEDGLADFCDGFGGGNGRERILEIMKDSHIGTYGVICLISYFLLTVALLASLTPAAAAITIFATDPLAKACTSQITNILPYARPEGAKNRISYSRMTIPQIMLNIFPGVIPVTAAALYCPLFPLAALLPATASCILISMMRRRIGGYTGDCCGACCLICEVSALAGAAVICNL